MKYIIIGAVAGGASTAARLRRLDEHAQIIIFEKGAYISYANCGLPYYIGDVIKDRNKLFVQTAESFNRRFNIDVRVQTEVIAIDAAAKAVTATDLVTGNVYTETYDKLLLSPGAEPIRPPLPGIGLEGIFTLRNVGDTDYIKAWVQQHVKRVAVIGAGFIGLEMAESLHGLGLEVTVIEMGNQVLAPVDFPVAAIAQRHIRSKGVDLRLNTAVTGFTKNGQQIRVALNNGDVLDVQMVLLSIGVRPDTKLAVQAGLQTGPARGIWVNAFLQTSNPDIYAVGDAIEFVHPISGQSTVTYLAGPANKQGRICANNMALGNVQSYQGAINTAIVKIFDITVGTTGMAAKHLAAANIAHVVSTNSGGSHAGYYPGADTVTIQIAFAPADGRLLGAQVVGKEGVDKRLDVLAAYIKLNKTVYDLAAFEHAYAPPYASAKDLVNMAGFVAENILLQRLNVFYWNELNKLQPEDILLDVRRPDEYTAGNIPGAVNIPLDEIRSRMNEIPAGKKIFIYCEAGLRGYLAQRILRQRGYNSVQNLSGGYQLWKTCEAEKALAG